MTAEIPVKTVVIDLCQLCLDGAGGECHVPGCGLYMNRAPDVEPRLSETAAVPTDVRRWEANAQSTAFRAEQLQELNDRLLLAARLLLNTSQPDRKHRGDDGDWRGEEGTTDELRRRHRHWKVAGQHVVWVRKTDLDDVADLFDDLASTPGRRQAG